MYWLPTFKPILPFKISKTNPGMDKPSKSKRRVKKYTHEPRTVLPETNSNVDYFDTPEAPEDDCSEPRREIVSARSRKVRRSSKTKSSRRHKKSTAPVEKLHHCDPVVDIVGGYPSIDYNSDSDCAGKTLFDSRTDDYALFLAEYYPERGRRPGTETHLRGQYKNAKGKVLPAEVLESIYVHVRPKSAEDSKSVNKKPGLSMKLKSVKVEPKSNDGFNQEIGDGDRKTYFYDPEEERRNRRHHRSNADAEKIHVIHHRTNDEAPNPHSKKGVTWAKPQVRPPYHGHHAKIAPADADDDDTNTTDHPEFDQKQMPDEKIEGSKVQCVRRGSTVDPDLQHESDKSSTTSSSSDDLKKIEISKDLDSKTASDSENSESTSTESSKEDEYKRLAIQNKTEELMELFIIKNPTVSQKKEPLLDEAVSTKFYTVIIEPDLVKYTVNKTKVTDNLNEFVNLAVPIGFLVQCRIIRDCKGVDRALFPTYFLHLEYEDGKKVFLLSARKRKKSKTSNYLIATDPISLTKETMIGKVRSNLLGTQFNIFGNGKSPKATTFLDSPRHFREELGVVVYDYNVLGFRGPRKVKILIPPMLSEHQRCVHRPEDATDGLIDRVKANKTCGILQLKNVEPLWHEGNQSYVLDFNGRVSKASVKNFQVLHKDLDDYILLQFGRIAENLFTLDFRFPLSPLQAFGMAIASLDNKLACE